MGFHPSIFKRDIVCLLSSGSILQSYKHPQAQPGIIHQESGRGRLSAAGQVDLNSQEGLGRCYTHLADLLSLRDNPGSAE